MKEMHTWISLDFTTLTCCMSNPGIVKREPKRVEAQSLFAIKMSCISHLIECHVASPKLIMEEMP